MKLRFLAPLPLLLAAVTTTGDARACGGCFHQDTQSTVVTGHRMALSVSPARSILWDQIEYAGDPKDFAWVLPVGPGAVLEESTDAWFETLDAATNTSIQNPQVVCPQITSPRSSCGAEELSDAAGSGGAGDAEHSVTIVHQGTVGPYETVTLSSDDANALTSWLTGHGYAIDKDIEPIIAAYVSEGLDFIALRLQPGQGVRSMKPVRVVTPGASPVLPLRMVAAGTGAAVAITLYTISESRLEAAGKYKNETITGHDLTWDFNAQTSDYSSVRKGTLAQNAGFTWLTSFAYQGAFLSPIVDDALGYSPGFGYSAQNDLYLDTIAKAYVNQGVVDGETTDMSCLDALGSIAQSEQKVVDPCPPGAPPDDPQCAEVPADSIDARTLACGKLDDLAAAFAGLHPASVWLTRLEANLPRLALAHDLTLEPAGDQSSVSNYLVAEKTANTAGLCPDNVAPLTFMTPAAARAARSIWPSIFGYGLLGLLVAGALGRRVTRPRVAR